MRIFFDILRYACEIMSLAIFLRAILSWFSLRPNALTLLLEKVTETVLAPLRRVMPRTGTFDFTPLVAIILLQLVAALLP